MKNVLPMAACAALVLAVAGCAANPGPGFGDSVRAMAEGQQYDPSAPHGDAGVIDGEKAVQAVDEYRAPRQLAAKVPAPTILIPGNP